MFNNLKFLFCMKNRVIIDYCSLYLRRKDCSCYTCDRKSEELYEAIKEKRPHVVLCDKKLEDGMSADVYERLEKEGIEVKFFINSSSYYSLGANNIRTRFYSKPVSPEYVYDEVVKIPNEAAFEVGSEFPKLEGALVGISSGGALWAAIQVAKRPENKGKNIVVLLPDSGDRYLSTPLLAK